MRAGRLSVHVVGVAMKATPSEPLIFEAELPEVGRVATQPSSDLRWEQGVSLDLEPQVAGKLSVALRTLAGVVVARGTADLEWTDADKQDLIVLLEGNEGEVSLALRYFQCRTPGKERDVLGRELVNEEQVRLASPRGCAPKPPSPVSSPRAGLAANRVPLRPRRGQPETTCA